MPTFRTRAEAANLVQYVVDDALNGRKLGADQFAVIRNEGFKHNSVIVLCNCNNGQTIGVTVHSYLDVQMDQDESIELATDYLNEIGLTVESIMGCY